MVKIWLNHIAAPCVCSTSDGVCRIAGVLAYRPAASANHLYPVAPFSMFEAFFGRLLRDWMLIAMFLTLPAWNVCCTQTLRLFQVGGEIDMAAGMLR